MIQAGYMLKKVMKKPDWLKAYLVDDIYSVSSCVSKDFADWIDYWKHNGYWFFNSPEIIVSLAEKHGIEIDGMTLFFYCFYEYQWDGEEWINFLPEKSFPTDVLVPEEKIFHGYDVVSYYCGTSAECSPLSCNHMAQKIEVTEHCLFSSFERAKECIENGEFDNCEPPPLRIVGVYTVKMPNKSSHSAS